ncbi:UDP-3-O-[3-hydroxymyristoyl] N-acetylglucosamine deacetylase [Rosistilla carotiformis]|uniref:UDP-3-O-acyl-N-acetylglucosamine deacetylase n=1 Tax=Rosistilla carotiformis TaxID=2528017 RepID=A0A518K0S7_9BACT|nr:UDP-3-O-acyl-N-acetylglucosamine deacetylase [Rosistilla carotiformis]QDV71404.1 UDP-3-O-[3-hydroxymyristoyl] N-acetylglucosamine deacetylase [Rosistilla carotiformis]
MTCQRVEHTIEAACQVTGRGYWSGQQVTVRFLPADPGSGIRFVRTDLPGNPSVPGLVGFRQSMSLRTVLSSDGGAVVSMVEHLMAALAALQIDNCEIQVDAEEMPGMDGSAAAFVDALNSTARVEQSTTIRPYRVDRLLRIGSASNWIEASPSDSDRFEVEYRLDYGDDCPIRPQTAAFQVTPESFAKELAPARTFVTADQAKQLRASGVAGHVTNQDLLIFDDHGLVENSLHFENECARHKAMDLVGDLALAGFPLIGRFVSHRGGHELNASMATQLQQLSCRSMHGSRKTA